MKICIIAHFAYGALAGGKTGHAGGVERQTSLTAKWLAARGHNVSFLTWDEGQDDEIEIDGVRVIKFCRKEAGIPGLRFFYPRWTSLIAGMKKANADLYYQNCGEYITGQVAMWCYQNGRRFVYSAANDSDCDPMLPEMRTLRERLLYRYGLHHADKIISQTEKQRQMLVAGFGLDSTVLPMPCPGPAESEFLSPKGPVESTKNRVIWVGRINEAKRLELLLDVAEMMKDVQFDVAGKPDKDSDYTRGLIARAGKLPNVTMHGMVSRERMPEFYRNASLLCCTSSFEGFPNTFLEAWSQGIPIVSTFDPDDLIANRELGFRAIDRDSIVNGIRKLIGTEDLWKKVSGNARKYYLKNHAVEPVMLRYEQLFLDTLRKGETAKR